MRDELNLTIEKLKERSLENGKEISEITIDSQIVYCRVYNSSSVADKTNILRDTALEAMKKYGTDITKRMYFTEISTDSPQEVYYCVAVPCGSEGEYIRHIPSQRAVSFFHHGAYEDIPMAREKLIKYAKDNNIRLSGVFRSVFLESPPQHKDKSKFITQVIAIIQQ